ncbi:MAG: MBL fold metallo-hydrolase [Chloroflexota bacterium]
MRVSQSCYAVTGLGFTPPWMVNAGFIVGEEKTLFIDTSANWLGAKTIVGSAMVIKPYNQRLVFNTEPHFDHIGGKCVFQDLDIDN